MCMSCQHVWVGGWVCRMCKSAIGIGLIVALPPSASLLPISPSAMTENQSSPVQMRA